MTKNIAKYFLFFVIFLIKKCKEEKFAENIIFLSKDEESTKNNNETNKTLNVAQTIMEQASYYKNPENGSSFNITRSFIDFYSFRFYYIDMKKINPNIKEADVTFEFYFDTENSSKSDIDSNMDALISIQCSPKFRCNKFYIEEHQYVSFDFDLYISRTGGVISFLLILVGIFCLLNGYIYFNITTAFFSGYSIFLLWREICELMELNHDLDTLHDTSKAISLTVYIFSIITSIVYGYISIKTKVLKYISFGFIVGLIIAKVFYYGILVIFDPQESVFLGYFLIEIISCIGFIIFFILIRNKNLKISIGTVSFIASYGILFGFHILIGGIPFIPFFILSKTPFNNYILEDDLFTTLKDGNKMLYYVIAFVPIVILGVYLNYSRYKLFIEKKKKNLSIL